MFNILNWLLHTSNIYNLWIPSEMLHQISRERGRVALVLLTCLLLTPSLQTLAIETIVQLRQQHNNSKRSKREAQTRSHNALIGWKTGVDTSPTDSSPKLTTFDSGGTAMAYIWGPQLFWEVSAEELYFCVKLSVISNQWHISQRNHIVTCQTPREWSHVHVFMKENPHQTEGHFEDAASFSPLASTLILALIECWMCHWYANLCTLTLDLWLWIHLQKTSNDSRPCKGLHTGIIFLFF